MDSILVLAADSAAWMALGTLIAMEVVLGIDNLLFISILTNKLPEHQRERARLIGISAALVLRLGLLSLVFVIVQLTEPVVTAPGRDFSWRDWILIGGGLFLVWKAAKEIHHNVDPDPGPDMFGSGTAGAGYAAVVGQILVLDLVFSVDSIITAIGMTEHVEIMVVAILVTVAVMLFAANPLATSFTRTRRW
jgi:predicted tellurium resistance membrane protein TerC